MDPAPSGGPLTHVVHTIGGRLGILLMLDLLYLLLVIHINT
jgi:hypothetical protein